MREPFSDLRPSEHDPDREKDLQVLWETRVRGYAYRNTAETCERISGTVRARVLYWKAIWPLVEEAVDKFLAENRRMFPA